MTPMQRQYQQIKAQHPQEIVLFRLGDFYEAFYDDAILISNVLGITLTGRGKGDSRIPMAGIPYHALPNYLPKLLQAGHKVALVEQLTEPQPGQLVEREVTKLYTPGTLTEADNLNEAVNNYLVAITKRKEIFGIAIADASTGDLQLWETTSVADLKAELERINPTEVLWDTHLAKLEEFKNINAIFTDYSFLVEAKAGEFLNSQLKVSSVKGFGVENLPIALSAAASAWQYIADCHKTSLQHFTRLRAYPHHLYMRLDQQTIRNLELLYSPWGDDKTTIYYHLNHCQTSMGKRLLRSWLLHPLLNAGLLTARWQSVATLKDKPIVNNHLREQLDQVSDLERLTARVATNTANAREVLALQQGLLQVTGLQTTLETLIEASLLRELYQQLHISTNLSALLSKLSSALNPEPPATLTEGGLIATGFDQQIDELRELRSGGRQTINTIQQREIERTGINSLKVSYNNVFGYYIEITKTHLDKVPADYVRKQTLTNAERFITQELKDWEDKVLNAESALFKREFELFAALRQELAAFADEILQVAQAVAQIDVLANFAYLAREHDYCEPELVENNEDCLEITAGRHPIVERLQSNFTPNDVTFDANQRLIILTGPNMSGKSTYIRQVALLTLLAQIGSFVPAKAFKSQLVDRIFTRVGAADNLARGESTFMVEMQETANILHNATNKSLIILDEVGRGTSTYDGVAIAWAIAAYLVKDIGAKTLFATHYHELTELPEQFPGAVNYHVAVQDSKDKLIFTHQIKAGGTSKSYGVHVAEMAGVPASVVKAAAEILHDFEQQPKAQHRPDKPSKPRSIHPGQKSLDL